MTPMHHFDDLRSLEKKINEKAHNLFKAKPDRAGLQVTRVFKRKIGTKDDSERNVVVKNADVRDLAQVKDARERMLRSENCDTDQIFTIRQDHSWTTLNISRDVFQGFMNTYNVMPPFWKHMFTFGRKSGENNFQFPHFSRRRTGVMNECAYILRRVELHGREDEDDLGPWSIRQTAVYYQSGISEEDLASKVQSGSTILLVAPSENVEWQLAQYLDTVTSDNAMVMNAWDVHRILIADSMRGWMDYMAYLESRLKEQSDRIVCATVGDHEENLSPLTDFVINFDDRQVLKTLEDQVLDLQVILPGMLDAIKELLCDSESRNEGLVSEFREYQREVKMLIERSKTLNDMATSTARLLSDLLSYEEAVSLKKLSYETQMESKSMSHLAEKSTKDAAAVKILTVITLIYLPFTIVANFFSTQFVQTQQDGHLHLATNVWLLAVIAIPLTAITIGLWWTWVFFTEVKPTPDPLQPGIVTLQRQHSFRSMVSSKKRSKKNDLESGLGFARSPTFPPALLAGSPASTWSSQATTVKSG
ncbi:hypothetical protein BDZ45DRAFT_732300 [Acephala macrosclerotiorum]|nr:hypothetical protein BDZ45DRAFT_732300 [Acephala macrosclerotiorum]